MWFQIVSAMQIRMLEEQQGRRCSPAMTLTPAEWHVDIMLREVGMRQPSWLITCRTGVPCELSAGPPLRRDVIGDGLVVCPPLRSGDVLLGRAHYRFRSVSRGRGNEVVDEPWTNPYPAGPMKLVHSAATLVEIMFSEFSVRLHNVD